MAKGFTGRNKNVFTSAQARVEKSLQYSYVGRKLKKRDNRTLWITQINSATREHGLKYNIFTRGLIESNIMLNRKVLSELAITEPITFFSLVNHVKSLNIDTLRNRKHKLLADEKKKVLEAEKSGTIIGPQLSLKQEDTLAERLELALKKAVNKEAGLKKHLEKITKQKESRKKQTEEYIAMITAQKAALLKSPPVGPKF